jgi:hypothetical protein
MRPESRSWRYSAPSFVPHQTVPPTSAMPITDTVPSEASSPFGTGSVSNTPCSTSSHDSPRAVPIQSRPGVDAGAAIACTVSLARDGAPGFRR